VGQLPNDTVIMVSFRPSSSPGAPPSAPHEVRAAADASEELVISHGIAREVQSAPSGNSITLTEPAQALLDNTVVDAADDLLLLKRVAAPPAASTFYWVFLYPRNAPHPPYSVNPPSPQAGKSYAITSNDGGRIRIVSTWPLVYAPSAGGPIPPFPG